MKIGVIGTGNMGSNHVRCYSRLNEICTLAGVFDTNPESCKKIAEKYGVSGFESLEKMLGQIDAVSIAVPTPYHYEIARTCIEKGIHVLIEKPIASAIWQAEDLVKRAKEKNVTLMAGHIELFNPAVEALKKLLKNEKLLSIEARRLNTYDKRIENVDVVEDLMIHDLYLLRYLTGSRPENLYAAGVKIKNTVKHASALIHLKNGIPALLTSSFRAAKPHRSIECLTENGTITADLKNLTIKISPLSEKLDSPDFVIQDFSNGGLDPLSKELTEFIQCCNSGSIPLVDGNDGIEALRLTQQIHALFEISEPFE